MSPQGKFLWLGGALIFFLFLGIAQLLMVVLRVLGGTQTPTDAILIGSAAAFAAFSCWVVRPL